MNNMGRLDVLGYERRRLDWRTIAWLLVALFFAAKAVRDARQGVAQFVLWDTCARAGFDDWYIGETAWCLQADPFKMVQAETVPGYGRTLWYRATKVMQDRAAAGLSAEATDKEPRSSSSARSEPIRALYWLRLAPSHWSPWSWSS